MGSQKVFCERGMDALNLSKVIYIGLFTTVNSEVSKTKKHEI